MTVYWLGDEEFVFLEWMLCFFHICYVSAQDSYVNKDFREKNGKYQAQTKIIFNFVVNLVSHLTIQALIYFFIWRRYLLFGGPL